MALGSEPTAVLMGMDDATTLVPPTYPELEQEVYAWLEEERLTIPPSEDEQFELELETMLG